MEKQLLAFKKNELLAEVKTDCGVFYAFYDVPEGAYTIGATYEGLTYVQTVESVHAQLSQVDFDVK